MHYESDPPHVRTQIREAIAQRISHLPTTADRIFVSRVYPLETAALPGIIIKTDVDQVDESNLLRCQLQLIVKAYAKVQHGLDALLDQIEVEVRKAIALDTTLHGIVKDITWLQTTIELEAGGEQPIGSAEMLFRVDYRIKESAPNVPLD